MKKFWLATAVLVTVLMNSQGAAAFSVDQSANQNTDGSPKFADPDEQTPRFLVSPDASGAGSRALSFGASSMAVPGQAYPDSGSQSFDKAFSHQQDKE